MHATKIILAAAAMVGLSACGQPEHLSADFGNAVNHNLSLQIVNPEPTYMAPENPDMDGERAALAIERYKSGTVIQPEQIDSTDAVSGN